MASKILVNLPVKDIGKSIEFYTKLGFTFNPQLSGDQFAYISMDENAFVLSEEEHFKNFTMKEICNAKKYTGLFITLELESIEQVDEMVKKAGAAGGSVYVNPQDEYGYNFADLDGHQWLLIYLD